MSKITTYEILMRFDDEGKLSGAHQQKLAKNDGVPDQILLPEPIDLAVLSDVVGKAMAASIDDQVSLNAALSKATDDIQRLEDAGKAMVEKLDQLTAANTSLRNENETLIKDIADLKDIRQQNADLMIDAVRANAAHGSLVQEIEALKTAATKPVEVKDTRAEMLAIMVEAGAIDAGKAKAMALQ